MKLTKIIQRHWQALFFWNVGVFGLVCVAIYAIPKTWTATTSLTVPGMTTNLDANLGVLGSLQNSGANVTSPENHLLKLQQNILTSDVLLERVLANDIEKEKFTDLKQYKSLFKTTIADGASAITVEVNASSSKLARDRADSLIKNYQQRLAELRNNNRSSRQNFSTQELQTAQARLTQAQQNLAKFQQASGLVNADEQTKSLVSTIESLTKQLADTRAQVEYSQNRAQTLAQRLQMLPDTGLRSLQLGENPDYQLLRRQLTDITTQLSTQRSKYTDNHPQVQELFQQQQALIARVRSQIAAAAKGKKIDINLSTQGEGRSKLVQELVLAETEASSQYRRSQQIQSQLKELYKALNTIPSRTAKLQELRRNVDVAEGVYKGLIAQAQQANINVFDAYPNVEVLDPPRVNNKPSHPKLSLMVLNGILAGFIGSIALLLYLERRNPLLTPQDLQEMKFPIVASLPQQKLKSEAMEVGLQRLASSVSLQELRSRRLLITSAMEGEGKTTITLGLARALVDLGFRVLMVDADFRQAELSYELGQQQNRDHLPITIEPNLDLLPTQPESGKIIGLVSRGGFASRLNAAQGNADYDYILIDTQPIGITSVTPLIVREVPDIIFVVRPGISHSNAVRESMELLNQHHANILGLIINGVEANRQTYQYRNYDRSVQS